MTVEPSELVAEPFHVIESTVVAEMARAGRKYAIEALGTLMPPLDGWCGYHQMSWPTSQSALPWWVGGLDLVALFGVVCLVSHVITGALAGVAYLTFGSAGR